MTNHSEVLNLSVQLIADAPPASTKHRTAVGLPSESDRHYDLAELKACGFDAMAATIVHHVTYNTKRHKCPKAYTVPYWQSFFGGCSKQQARTAIKHAMAAEIDGVKLLETSYSYFAKVWSPHYLYVGPGVESNTPSGVDINTPSTEGNLQKETEKKQIQKHGSDKPEPTGTPEDTQAESGKIEPPNPTPEILVEYTEHEALKKHPDYWRYELWSSLMVKHGHPVSTYVKPKRMKEYLSMLQRLEYRLPQHGGDTLESFIDTVVRYWETVRLEYICRGYGVPEHPTIAFLTKFGMKVYTFNSDAAPATSSATPMAEPAPCVGDPQPVQPPVELAFENGLMPADEYPDDAHWHELTGDEYHRWLALQPKPEAKKPKTYTCIA
jgi:hypothetical protein